MHSWPRAVGRLPRAFALSLAPVVLAACAEDAPDDASPDDDLDKSALHGWVVIERAEGDGRVRTSVSAKFLQVGRVGSLQSEIGERDSSSQTFATAASLVGGRVNVPAVGDCVPLGSLEETASEHPGVSIDLVDVGDVTLQIQEPDAGHAEERTTRLSLSPRAFPDIGDLVSGVFYTSPDASVGLPVPAEYEIGGTGSTSVDAFLIDVRAPEAPRNLVVAGVLADDEEGASAGLPPITVASGADIEIGWRSLQPGVSSQDVSSAGGLIFVDVRSEGDADSFAHRCTFPDGGAAVLPSGVLHPRATAASLTIHRLAERSSTMRGMEDAHGATVVFDLSRTVRLDVTHGAAPHSAAPHSAAPRDAAGAIVASDAQP
ncbi:MAG: hypothetical protein HOW73_50945 [Polyangiaceae bacterium]|nr:hypothetical protein [Polyangiaceae bacterium]